MDAEGWLAVAGGIVMVLGVVATIYLGCVAGQYVNQWIENDTDCVIYRIHC